MMILGDWFPDAWSILTTLAKACFWGGMEKMADVWYKMCQNPGRWDGREEVFSEEV
jgi:hypothetical protein